MAWSKLSDTFADECETLSDGAFRLHVEALCWNGRKLLDCRIPISDLRRFAKDPSQVDELLAVGWWSQDGDSYQIRHHANCQRTREDVLNQQAANATNGSKGGRPKGSKKTHSVSDSVSDSVSKSVSSYSAVIAGEETSPHKKTHLLSDSKSERERKGKEKAVKEGSLVDEVPTLPTVTRLESAAVGRDTEGNVTHPAEVPEIPARLLPRAVSE